MQTKHRIDLFTAIAERKPMYSKPEPEQLRNFRSMKRHDRERESEKFFAQEFIKDYLDAKWKIELFNKVTFEQLWDLYKQENNPDLISKLENKLSHFKRVIEGTESPYRALMIDFSKYDFEEVPASVALAGMQEAAVNWND